MKIIWLCLCSVIIVLNSCKERSPEISEKGFTSYKEASDYVKKTYESETLKSNSEIQKVEYYSDGYFLMIYFKSNTSKGYLYQNFPVQMWDEFKNAGDIYQFYKNKIKGKNKYFLKI